MLHRDCRAHGPESIVLVDARDAEHGHHAVAEELLDRAAMLLDRLAHLLEVGRHDLAQRLGVDRLAQRGRSPRSQKTIVTVLRTSVEDFVSGKAVPQWPQNRNDSALTSPHIGQTRPPSGLWVWPFSMCRASGADRAGTPSRAGTIRVEASACDRCLP